MKYEKEFFILIDLLNSKHLEGGLFTKGIPVSIRELETNFGLSQNNNQFRRWLKKAIVSETMKCVGTKETVKGQNAKLYLFNQKRLEEMIRSNPLYPSAWKYYQRKSIGGIMDA